jgi:hypothetical protein
MQDGFGYWIYMTKPDILNETGWMILPAGSPPAYPLSAGWNWAGFKPQPVVQSETVAQYLTSISGSYAPKTVWVYDNTSGAWIEGTSSTMLSAGEAM